MKKLISILLTFSLIAPFANAYVLADGDGIELFMPGMEYPTDPDAVKKDDTVSYIQSDGLVSYADMTDMSKVGILGELGIMGAYSDNLFKPNVYVSRAQFVESLLKTFQIDYSGKPNLTERFYDVPDDSTHFNVVYNAYLAGIVTGYDDNTFGPDRVLSFDEAVILSLRALGYEQTAKYAGSYSVISAKLGLGKGVSINNPVAMTRLEMAELLYNVLNTNIQQLAFGTEEGQFKYTDGDTPLYRFYNILEDVGIVTANRLSGFDGVGTDSKNLIINGKKYTFESDAINQYLGYKVNYFYREDDDSLVFLTKHKDVREVIATNKDILELDYQSRRLTYVVNNKTKYANYTANTPIFYNGVLLAGNYSKDIFAIDNGSVRLISNDNGNYSVMFIEDYDNYQISAVKKGDNDFTLLFMYYAGNIKINPEQTYVEIVEPNGNNFDVYKKTADGNTDADISCIKAGMIASIAVDNEGWIQNANGRRSFRDNPKHIKILLSDKKLAGAVTSRNDADNEITIRGEESTADLYISSSNYFDQDDCVIKLGEDVELYLDYFGYAVALKSGKSTFKYGYIVSVGYDEDDDSIYQMRIFTTGGKVVTYPTSTKMLINGKLLKDGKQQRAAIAAGAALVNPSFKNSQVVKYKLDSNEENQSITEIQLITSDFGVAPGYSEDWLRREERGTYYVDDDTQQRLKVNNEFAHFFKPKYVFTVPTSENSDPTKYSAAQITHAPKFEADAYDVVNLVPTILVRYNDTDSEEGVKTYNSHVYPLMFSEATRVFDPNEGLVLLKITAASGWEVKTLYSENLNICDKLSEGDLAYFYMYDEKVSRVEPVLWSKGELSGLRVNATNLPDIDSDSNNSLGTTGEFVYRLFGELLSQNGSDFVVQYGPKVNGAKRQYQLTGRFSNKEWMHGGVILYQTDGKDVTIRQGNTSDIRTVENYGDKASKVLCVPIHGAGRQYIVFNLE